MLFQELHRKMLRVIEASMEGGCFHKEAFAETLERCFAGTGFRRKNPRRSLRILVSRLDGLGDLIMTTPFLRELRRNFPTAHITVVVKPDYYDILATCSYINQVLSFDSSYGYHYGVNTDYLKSLLDFAHNKLWPSAYDICFVPRFDIDEFSDGLLCLFSGANHRIGFNEKVTSWKYARSQVPDKIYTHIIPDLGYSHEVERGLSMLERLGAKVREKRLELWTQSADEAWAEQCLQLVPRPLAALSIGNERDRRFWPIERYVEYLQRLVDKYQFSFVLLGSSNEMYVAEQLMQRKGNISILNLAGRTALRQMAAVLRRCNLYIGRDTGTKHMAAAMGTPVLEISCHSTQVPDAAIPSPARYRAWRVPHVEVQPEKAIFPCDKACSMQSSHCILLVSVEQVMQKTAELLTQIGVEER